MGKMMRCGMILGWMLLAAKGERAQTITTPSGQTIGLAKAPAVTAADTRKLNEKQRILSNEADQLLAMATELKAEVDMTSKNILSVKVVRKAEEIEQYAHILKERAKK